MHGADRTDPFGWVGATVAGKYHITAVVGHGGFGVVFQATHLTLGHQVALKCLKLGSTVEGATREKFLEHFLEEGRLLHRLSRSSTGIVQALDAGAEVSPNGTWCPYLVLEWLEGRTLAEDIARRGPRSLGDAMALLWPAVQAIEMAHGQKIAHRDLKPENLFLANVGGGSWTTKVLDFGVAKVMDDLADLTVGTASTGTATRAFSAAYGAPEQFDPNQGPTGPWTDVYSLALVLLETVAARRPYSSETRDALAKEAMDREHRPSFHRFGINVPSAVARVVERALEVDPRNRFARAGAFWTELSAAAAGAPVVGDRPALQNLTEPASLRAPPADQGGAIETMLNWIADRDLAWWPFLYLRPPKHELLSWVRVTKITLHIFTAYALIILTAIGAIYFTGKFGLERDLFGAESGEIAAFAFFGYVLLLSTSIVVGRLTFGCAWNRRAMRLVRAQPQPAFGTYATGVRTTSPVAHETSPAPHAGRPTTSPPPRRWPALAVAALAFVGLASIALSSVTPKTAKANDGADPARPVLSDDDQGFVDTRGGWGWGDRCWININKGKWGWAKAECDEGMKMNPASPQPRASLLYNQGLIAKAAGRTDEARTYFAMSLALRENAEVRAALRMVDGAPSRVVANGIVEPNAKTDPTKLWHWTFHADLGREIQMQVNSDGRADLDCWVDLDGPNKRRIQQDLGPSRTCALRFTPTVGGTYRLSVGNYGPVSSTFAVELTEGRPP